MKHAFFRLTLLVSLLTFISLPNAAQDKTDKKPRFTHVNIEVTFIQFVSNAYHTYAQYKVTNRGTEAVRYPGSAVNSNWLVVTKQGALIKQGPRIFGTHLFGTYSLSPGESFVSDLQLPDGDEAFQIGFGYQSGRNHVWNFAWSKDIKPPTRPTGRD